MTLVDSLGVIETMRVDPRAPIEGGAVFGTCVIGVRTFMSGSGGTPYSPFYGAVRLEQPGAAFDLLEISSSTVSARLNGATYVGGCQRRSINDSGRYAPSFVPGCELTDAEGESVTLSGTFEFLDCDDDS